MPPKLSVVVPVHNVEKYLEKCLVSLADQTFRDLEVIVVDDGSPDRSGQIADRFAEKDSRFIIVHTPNSGVSAARNTGIERATGEYLAFVDPDDLVPPRAFALMIATLESTGSDFAAGNAWRFAEGVGTVQSWTHSGAFWRDRLGTHIRDYHPLLRDRMVWNKVYRRSFWDDNDLSFPLMKYEDYPVAMQAHLLAKHVDVLSDKVYMWRNRESGDSITQQLGQLSNARDRVRSAEMVLDIFRSHGADPDLLAAVQSYLIDIDVVALATGLTLAVADEVPEIERLAHELAMLIEPQQQGTTRLARIIHSALRDQDFEAARLLAQWRTNPSRRELVQSFVQRRNFQLLPKIVDAVVPRATAPKILRPRKLRSELVSFKREDDHFLAVTLTKLSASMLKRAHISAWLVSDSRSVELETRWAPVAGGFRLSSRMPSDLIYLVESEAVTLQIRVSSGALRWRGTVPAPSNLLPCPIEGTQERWLTPATPNGQVGLRVVSRPVPVAIALRADALEVIADAKADGALVVVRPFPSAPFVAPAPDGKAHVRYEDLVADDPADNPFSGESLRRFGYVLTRGGVIDGERTEAGVLNEVVAHEWPPSVEWGDYRFEVCADIDGAPQVAITYLPAEAGSSWLPENLSDLIRPALGKEGS